MMYQLTGEPWIYRVDDDTRIPPGHPDYQDYLNWVAAGNIPLPPSEEQMNAVREHMECTDIQAFLALDAAGLGAQFEAWMNDPARTLVQKAFLRSQKWQRLNPTLVAAAKDDWGMTDEQIDGLFQLAKTL